MRNVSILTTSFFDDKGHDFILGGNERYLLDMIDIYSHLGIKSLIYQPSKIEFNKKLSNNVEIIGVPFRKINSESYVKLNKYFYNNAANSILYHYQTFILAYPYSFENSIGICHGVSWDKPIGYNWEDCYRFKEYIENRVKKYVLLNRYYKAAKSLKQIIANDTNFINWARITWPDVVKKITYLPNYVDLNLYKTTKASRNNDRIKILFPRRLSRERGFLLTLEVARDIINKYEYVDFYFTGDKPTFINEYIDENCRNLYFHKFSYEDMNEAYKMADIVIIPTIFSEGTSLSCLEAMASGKAIIASDVGGLTNLIIDDYNGILIKPNKEELFAAIEQLIMRADLRIKYGKNSLDVANAFSKKRWEEKWVNQIETLLR